MSRRSDLPEPSEIPSVDDEPAFFDPAPEWFVPGVKPLRGEAPEPEDDDLGLRAILESPEALARAWQASGPERRKRRGARRRGDDRSRRSPTASP